MPGLAEVAQLVEQLTCNEKVGGSIPLFGKYIIAPPLLRNKDWLQTPLFQRRF